VSGSDASINRTSVDPAGFGDVNTPHPPDTHPGEPPTNPHGPGISIADRSGPAEAADIPSSDIDRATRAGLDDDVVMSDPSRRVAGDEDRPLDGGWRTTVHRVGDTIRRSPSPWSPSVIGLLRHLDDCDFAGSPRPVGSGFDGDGNEVLTFIEGRSLQPAPWDDGAIVILGQMLAGLHAATRSFRPDPHAVWCDWFGRSLGNPTGCFGHGDLGPWNIMAVDGVPSGFIDWDTSGPMDPVYELAQVAWLNVQLHDDDVGELVGLGDVGQRAEQLGLLLDAYRLPTSEREGFVDKMVEVAVRDAAGDAIEHAVTPTTTTGQAANGYPFAWGMAWRIRSAAWMLRHRSILEASVGQ